MPREALAITADIKSVNLALPDVTLRMDMDGVIREVSLANSVSTETVEGWVGRPWVETVSDVDDAGGDKILQMVAEARANGVSDFRQVMQVFPSGLSLPMEYNTVRLGGNAGLIAIGKNLQAVTDVQSRLLESQHAREQDSWKLRTVETRHRLLFESSDDPILLLRTDNFHVVDANPAAVRAGALDSGRDFPAAVAPADRAAFQAMMERVSRQGRAPGQLLHLGTSATRWLVRASLATSEPEAVYLLQLAPIAAIQAIRRETASLVDLIDRLPDSFVLVDAEGIVRRANRAFLDLVQCGAPAAAIGQPLTRWLGQPGADGMVLIDRVMRHRMVRNFTTTIQGDLGTEVRVEISAAGDAEQAPQTIGLLLRDVSRRLANEPTHRPTQDDALRDALAEITAQIGRTPLLELVRDSSGLIERHCIEGALERVHGNRTAAAEILGMSRQSLYAKLSRYGIGGNGEERPLVS